MFGYKMNFAGETSTDLSACHEHAEALERIGREIVDLLRHHGFTVTHAHLSGPTSSDLVSGSVRQASPTSDEVTRNERKPGSKDKK